MRVAFSTLACPSWDIERIVAEARTLGYDGIELRLLDGEVIDPTSDRAAVQAAVALARAQRVDICALDSSCQLNQADEGAREVQLEELHRWIDLAAETGTGIVRVFGGPDAPGMSREIANATVAGALARAAPHAEAAGVAVVLETHDAYASARRVADVLYRVPSPAIGALWDSFHPYRMGESVAEALALLGPRLLHVHVKDARHTPDGWELALLGEGDVPVADMIRLVRQSGYAGYLSVEWEKKWHPEIAAPEVALPQHLDYLRRLDG